VSHSFTWRQVYSYDKETFAILTILFAILTFSLERQKRQKTVWRYVMAKRKLNAGAQLQIFPYPMTTKRFQNSRVNGEVVTTTSTVQTRNGDNCETPNKNAEIFRLPHQQHAKLEPHQTSHVIVKVRIIFVPQKLLGSNV